jgi:hypothetical protein
MNMNTSEVTADECSPIASLIVSRLEGKSWHAFDPQQHVDVITTNSGGKMWHVYLKPPQVNRRRILLNQLY